MDFHRESSFPIHLTSAAEDFVRTMDYPLAFETIPFAKKWIDDVYLDSGIPFDVLYRLR